MDARMGSAGTSGACFPSLQTNPWPVVMTSAHSFCVHSVLRQQNALYVAFPLQRKWATRVLALP